ncbi:AAA family ATPase [Dyadobacter sp. 3J3]|uniref:phosphatase domain-containing protein n=1 Tax=Dyadobacter sp. 3J3 TaxID=2606600 RepID=UPI001358AB6A|nr:AAA family ATPase [Dyadobacter sp. 3J3]
MKVILTKWLPGSGKSTWAKSIIDKNPNTYKRINKDDLRSMMDNSNWSKDSEKFIIKVRDTLILLALEQGKHVIIDDTNLAPKHEVHIHDLIRGKAELEIKDFTDVSIDTCIKWDLKRANSVGEKVIRNMHNQFLKPENEIIEFIDGLTSAIICDLDGTLANLNGRNPYDASKCDNDLLNHVVAGIIKGKTVIFMSGREDKYRAQTEFFLSKHGIEYVGLFMRATGDSRKDSIVKRELFDANVRGRYNIEFVLDDRNQVVETWRQMGLICLQVAEGDF